MDSVVAAAVPVGAGGQAPIVEFKAVSRVYGRGASQVKALERVDFNIAPGEFVALIGPSGAGKSTCLNLVGCLDRPSSGACLFDGVDVGGLTGDQRALIRRHFIGFIFQGFNLLNRTTALENVELPLVYRRMPASKRRAQAREALASVGLSDREDHTPGELSGGQQQRVAIARAIVTQPSLLLADEPTGNLDTATSSDVMEVLVRLNRERTLTIVMVTHENRIAAYAGREMHFRDGRIVADRLYAGS